MKKTLIFTLLIVVFGGVALTGCGGKEGTDISAMELDSDFAGVYKVDGGDYAADVTIEKTGKHYHMLWEFDGSASKTYGKGIELNGVLGAVFADIAGFDVGAIIYIKEGDGLTGVWTPVESPGLSFEKTPGTKSISPARPDNKGTYKTTGKRPDGSEYEGELVVKSFGKRFSATWKIGEDEVLEGSGMALGNVLVLGYGAKKETSLAVYEIKGSELEGSWLHSETIWLSKESALPMGTESCVKQQ